MAITGYTDKKDYGSDNNIIAGLNNIDSLYCQAIENIDGVPFHLIFGPHIGEGYYKTIGSGIERLIGVPVQEFNEKIFHEMIEEIVPYTDDIPMVIDESRSKFINGEIKSYKADILIRLKDGEEKWIQDSSLPYIDEVTGKIIGAYGILFDIDDRKKTLLNLEKTRVKAEESDRLKTAFLHNISHEIRTPLNAIVGFSTLLGDTENDPVKRKEFTDILFNSTEHLLEIINNIVEIANLESGNVTINREPVSPAKTLACVYNRFTRKACNKNITLRYVEPPDAEELTIITDRYKLDHIMTNLVDNALKFTLEGTVELGFKKKGNKLEFYVSDTGIGISEEHTSLIFNRFSQVENNSTRRFEGTGLGLPITKSYLELLNGNIWFTSEPGKGSVFYFTLPL